MRSKLRIKSRKPIEWEVKRQLYKKNIVTPESKYAGATLPSVFGSIGSTWVEVPLANPAQNVTFATRVGRKIRVTGWEIKGTICEGSTDAVLANDDLYDTVRVIIGTYKLGGITPLATSGAGINTPVERMLNTQGRLIKKYYDKYIALGTQGAGHNGYCPDIKSISIVKRLKKPIVIEYGDDTANSPDKLLIMSCISDSAGIPNPGFTAGYFRVWYTDE